MRKQVNWTIDEEILKKLKKEFINESRLVEALLRKHFAIKEENIKESFINLSAEETGILGV